MNKTWNIDLIGVLADQEYVLNTIDKQAVYINSQNGMQFFVKIISEAPESFPTIDLVTCFGDDLEKWGFEDNYQDHPIDRIQALKDFLQDNLIVFKPQRKVLYDHTEVYVGRDLTLVPKAESYQDGIMLVPFPVFSKEEHGNSFLEFREKLQNRRYLGKIESISNEKNDTPRYILWKNSDFDFVCFGEFNNHHYAHGGFAFSAVKPIRMIPFQEEWIDDCYEHENVLFIPLEINRSLTEMVLAAEIIIQSQEGRKLPTDLQKAVAQTAVTAVETEQAIQSENEKFNSHSPVELVGLQDSQQSIMTQMTEEKLMEEFIQITRNQGLLYDIKDLYNFHTAMKSSNLVILAGMSGTGKSKLVHAYGKALGLFDRHQMTFIPVRPAWTDDADLIGYADTLHMVYRPGDSGVINALMSAKENRDKLHIICFDEMNLARVEHYFSQFLSVLEMESGPNRVLRLYNEDLENRLYNSAQYPPLIPIGDNVIFVGTVNLDESTYHFSDKVLDRANVISLHVLPFSNLRSLIVEVRHAADEKRILVKKETVPFELYNSFRNNSTDIQMDDLELSLLWEIHVELQKVNKNIGAGPRIVRQIDRYLKNLPKSEHFKRQEAVDLQIVQRILTKVRGPEEQLKKFIGSYDHQTENILDSKLGDILDRYEQVSEFYETRNLLIHKAKELKINGYTL